MIKFSLVLSVLLLITVAKVSSQSYSKSCFINYLLKYDFLDKSYEIHKDKNAVDAKCEAAMNSTVTKIRSTTNNVCVSEFYRRKYVSESLVKQYLLPQFKNSQKQVHFGANFDNFLKKALNISAVICNNPKVFKPDLKALLKNGKLQQDSKTKEISCLQNHIMVKNKPLSEECKKIVDRLNRHQKDFSYSTEVSLANYEKAVEAVRIAINEKNAALDVADAKTALYNAACAAEEALLIRLRGGIAAGEGKNSDAYVDAGGTRQSDITAMQQQAREDKKRAADDASKKKAAEQSALA